MKQIARIAAGLGFVAACQRSAGSTERVAEAYRRDIARVCDVVAQSGAAEMQAGARALAIATWLSDHLETQDARDYVIRIQPLVGEAHAAALDAEARRVGLASCALSAEWRADPEGEVR